jgi:hypothetical protein
MTTKIIFIGIMITALMVTNVANASYAITNSTSNIDRPLYRQIQDLIENPFFGPDYSCLFDVYQLHCIPGKSQECPEGFGTNEDYTCFPLRDECPEGYHTDHEDETGQCYPDTEPCSPGMIRYPERYGREACGSIEDVCRQYNASLKESCFVEGRTIVNFPNTSCLTNPDSTRCNLLEGYGCPTGFAMMTSVNFTTPKCIPMDDEEMFEEERERKVFDQNRCTKGYDLQVNADHLQVLSRGDNIGQCVKQR